MTEPYCDFCELRGHALNACPRRAADPEAYQLWLEDQEMHDPYRDDYLASAEYEEIMGANLGDD